ncbi:hypothetical protein ACIA2T_34240 [Amycolatopsis japonica]|uniref:hypothetical protein n=1 Tax=Amycolatopsis japonica TaxID=208439 RepID=UPI00379F9A4C
MRRDALHEMLRQTQKSMIVTVMIHRNHDGLKQSHKSFREHHDDDTFPILEPSFKVFLFDANGRCEEL